MKEQLNKIKECITTMMDILPNPAIAVVTLKNRDKIKQKETKEKQEEVGIELQSNGLQKES